MCPALNWLVLTTIPSSKPCYHPHFTWEEQRYRKPRSLACAWNYTAKIRGRTWTPNLYAVLNKGVWSHAFRMLREILITCWQPRRFAVSLSTRDQSHLLVLFWGSWCDLFQDKMERNSITFFSLHGKNNLQGWEEQMEVGRLTLWGGRSLSAGGCLPGSHLPPSAQFGGNLSLACRSLSGHRHQPSEIEELSKEPLAQGSSRGRERSMGGDDNSKHIVHSKDVAVTVNYPLSISLSFRHKLGKAFDHETWFKKWKTGSSWWGWDYVNVCSFHCCED